MAADPIFYALPVFFGSILVEAACARVMGKRVYDLQDALTSLNLGTLSQIVGAFAKLLTFGIYALIYHYFSAHLWPTGGLLAWAAALLFYDFCYYWLHRMGHEVGVLWAAHVVHHSSEYYNLSTALRQTSTGPLLSWIFYTPMALIGVPPGMFITVALIDLLYQYWVHTELIGRCGVLDYILVTPSNHRVHHGQNDYCIDRNYGGILILWDRLFGTFADERADEKIVYGVRKQLASFNPIWGNLHVYRDLWQESRTAPTWRAKIGVWFAPPGGWRDGPVPHFDTSLFSRFAPAVPMSFQFYVLFQFVLASIATSAFMRGDSGLPREELALIVVASLFCQGGLLQGAPWARWVEGARLAAVMALGFTMGVVAPWVVGASVVSLGWFWVGASGRRDPAVVQ